VSDANVRVAQEWMDAYNDGDLSRWDASVHPNISGAINAMPIEGRAAMKMMNQAFLDAAPDQRAETSHWVGSQDLVAYRSVYRGTMTGDYMGMPPSVKRFEFVGQYIVRIADGQLVEGYAVLDLATLMSQLGIAD
jgi:predicted ester cyclase